LLRTTATTCCRQGVTTATRSIHTNMSVEQQFAGKWLEEKKEGFQCLADALGLSAEQRAFFSNSQSELSYSCCGDTWTIQVGIVGVPHSTTFSFRMGEVYDSTNIDGSPLKSVIRQEGSKLVERHESTGDRHFIMDIVRQVEGDLMQATTSIGGVSMMTIYKRP